MVSVKQYTEDYTDNHSSILFFLQGENKKCQSWPGLVTDNLRVSNSLWCHHDCLIREQNKLLILILSLHRSLGSQDQIDFAQNVPVPKRASYYHIPHVSVYMVMLSVIILP